MKLVYLGWKWGFALIAVLVLAALVAGWTWDDGSSFGL